MAGDQQAATIGQGCFEPGMMKSTYGTGCFALLNTGPDAVRRATACSRPSPISSKASAPTRWKARSLSPAPPCNGCVTALKIIASARDVGAAGGRADPAEQVYLVPAFVGLGAPYWDAQARGAIYGLTRNSGAAEFARAALKSVGYQTRDLLEAMRADWPRSHAKTVLRVDGGMTASDP